MSVSREDKKRHEEDGRSRRKKKRRQKHLKSESFMENKNWRYELLRERGENTKRRKMEDLKHKNIKSKT